MKTTKTLTAFLLIVLLLLSSCGNTDDSQLSSGSESGASNVDISFDDSKEESVEDTSNTSDASDEESIDDISEISTEESTDSSSESSQPETSEEVSEEIKNTFKNPAFSETAADPFVTYHNGYYYATKTDGLSLSLYRSRSADALFTDEKKEVFVPAWLYLVFGGDIADIPQELLEHDIQSDIWAPELHFNPKTDRWYIYASGATKSFEFNTIRMFCFESASNDPWSDYTYKGHTDPDVLAIDQTVFYDEKSGNLYTAFSEFTSDKGQVITFALMENPWTISDKRIQISYPKYSWEKLGSRPDKDSRVNEGPIFTYKNGKLCLIYSASGCWSEYYCLGLVEFMGADFSEENMLNPNNWDKRSFSVFKAANEVYGVGHCSFFSSPDGTETWIAYHGMATPDAGEGGRYLYLQKIDFYGNGIPVLGEPLSRDTEIPYPSGDPKAE